MYVKKPGKLFLFSICLVLYCTHLLLFKNTQFKKEIESVKWVFVVWEKVLIDDKTPQFLKHQYKNFSARKNCCRSFIFSPTNNFQVKILLEKPKSTKVFFSSEAVFLGNDFHFPRPCFVYFLCYIRNMEYPFFSALHRGAGKHTPPFISLLKPLGTSRCIQRT